ncbi:MAG: phospho-sugar mutase [Eubacteriales bacterium]
MSYIEEYKKWLSSPALTEEERRELESLKDNEKEIQSRFYAPLTFGTAGLRGVMATGLHNMNVYVIRQVTQGIAELVISEKMQKKGVAISYDCRHNSEDFARQAACVLAANGVQVYLFDGMRPTPQLSFAIRHLGCAAGINITASHNPPEYNGFKAYWSDGAQLPPKHAAVVEEAVSRIDIFEGAKLMDFDLAVSKGLIQILGQQADEAFLEKVMSQSIDTQPLHRIKEEYRIVYTPFHGVGYKMVPEVLRRIGCTNIICVPEQMEPDGDFPTVASPNPENPDGFELAIKHAKEHKAHLIIGTDPDADRVAIVAPNREWEYVQLSGNQTAVLLLDYIIVARRRNDLMPENPFTVKSIVSTEMARAVSEGNGIPIYDTFTGFKFIAEKIAEQEELGHNCIFSFEESIGYLIGNHCRDKDAVTASMLLAEMCAYYVDKDMTLFEALDALYKKYGSFDDETINIVMPGLDGQKKMKELMKDLRSGTKKLPSALKLDMITDYLDGTCRDMKTGTVQQAELSGSDVLGFHFEGGSKLMVRPSGTEPKIKFYLLAHGNDEEQVKSVLGYMKGFVSDAVKNYL